MNSITITITEPTIVRKLMNESSAFIRAMETDGNPDGHELHLKLDIGVHLSSKLEESEVEA